MAEKKLSVVITGDAKGARKAFGEVGSSAGGMQSKLQTVGAGVGKVFKAASVGAGVLAVGVGAFLKGGVDSLIELEKLGAQTEAVIKSTGGAAGVTAEQVSAYADSIEKATGVEAEGIISGQNMLLTFTNLKNGVGEGNDIFNQATDIMTDMSVAMGTDASTTAVQLGKALNDPIKGISALSKVGVTFTEQQKAQIKAMVASGDTMGAQKIILAELNKEFGGSAAAFGDTTAGKVAKLKNLFGDFAEALASRLLPVISKVADWLADKIPAASAMVQEKIAELGPTFDKVAGYARGIGDAFAGFAEKARPVFEAIASFIASNPAPVLAALGAVAAVAFGAWAVSAGAAAVATIAAAAPVLLLVGAIALLAGGLVYAYQHFTGFRNVVDGVVQWVTGTALPALQAFAGMVASAFGALVTWVQTHWGQIKGYIEGAINAVATVVGGVIGALKIAWQTWGDELVTIAQTYWAYIKGTVENGINLVKGVIDVVMGIIRGDWSQAWDGLKGILGAVWDQIKLAVETGVELLKTVLSAAWDAIKGVAKIAWDAFKKVISDAIDGAVEFAKSLPGRIVAAIGDLNQKLYQAGKDLIAGLVRGITDSIPSVSGVLGTVTDMIPDWKGPAARDAKLLEPAGRLIMDGLVTGINDGIPNLQARLDFISALVATQARANVDAFWAAQSRINSQMAGAQQNEDGSWSQSWMGTPQQESEMTKWLAALRRFFNGGTDPVTPNPSASGRSGTDGMSKAAAEVTRMQGETTATVTDFSNVLDRLNWIMDSVSTTMTLAEARAAVFAATAQQAARGADALARWNEALTRFFAGGAGAQVPMQAATPTGPVPAPAQAPGRPGAQSATYVTIQMNGPVLDGRELGRLAAEGLNEYGASQNGPIIATGLVGAGR